MGKCRQAGGADQAGGEQPVVTESFYIFVFGVEVGVCLMDAFSGV